jgi:hypothetical protein
LQGADSARVTGGFAAMSFDAWGAAVGRFQPNRAMEFCSQSRKLIYPATAFAVISSAWALRQAIGHVNCIW